MSEWVSVVKSRRKPQKRKQRGVSNYPPAALVWVTEDDWTNRFDPIDREMYCVFKAHYPNMLSIQQLLEYLKDLNPEENDEYTLNDVVDSLELCLKPYIVEDDEKNYQLKTKFF
jgi:hypothetical protein